MPGLSELLFPRLNSRGFALSTCKIGPEWDDPALLLPEERALLAGMVAVRRREFIAGRVQARALMQRMGHAPVPVLAGAGRQAIWPGPLIGSISHTRQLCAVALASRMSGAAVGIDLELFSPIERNLQDRICNRRELDILTSGGWTLNLGELVCCVFSAKEAFYKAWYPVTGRFLEYEDVIVTLAPSLSTYTVELSNPTAELIEGLDRLAGEIVIHSGHVATSFVWENAIVTPALARASGFAPR